MIKFFRKYDRVMLAVLLSLLMVVFIGGVALESALQPDPNFKVANTELGPIGNRDQMHAASTTEVLQRLGMNWNKPVAGSYRPLDIVDWIMLTREARRYATPIDERAARAWMGAGGEDTINRMARNLRVKPEVILEAISDLRSIQQATQSIGAAAVPSTAQVRSAAKEVLDRAKVNAVVLPAAAFVDKSLTFTDAEIEAQWTPYKDVPQGEGLNFGYYMPLRVEAQFIVIDSNKIAEQLGVPNLEKKARKYYDENKGKFTKLSLGLAADPADPGASATWEEAKTRAMDAVRKQVAKESAARIADWLVQSAAEPFVDAERLKTGYRKAPVDVAVDNYYGRLVANIPASINYPAAIEIGVALAFTETEADIVIGLGQSTHRAGSGEIHTLRSLAFRSEPAVPVVPQNDGAGRSEYLSLWQTCPYPLTNDDEGKVFVFRITRSADGRASFNSKEVRTRITEDLRLLRAMDSARMKAKGLIACVGDSNLKDAFDADAELQARQKDPGGGEIGFFTTPPVARAEQFQVGSDSPNQTVYAGPGVEIVPRNLIDEWFALANAPEKMTVQEIKNRAAVMVVELAEIKEATTEQFAGLRDLLSSQISSKRSQEAISSWMNPDNIRARNGFALIGAEQSN